MSERVEGIVLRIADEDDCIPADATGQTLGDIEPASMPAGMADHAGDTARMRLEP
ncbi:hypothetical protein roselon_00746 [Roseibacterium elongatum DSM 19469]|uniref:Uncharacterized protein n=1 Tax=Roseicyclus elongatus DSM 19469 TaxID=1294273 RepID=W8SKV5_9RHOB|nr:hypothetical protein roselon_00746 [Roseibacterium elongatum DSM 19469]